MNHSILPYLRAATTVESGPPMMVVLDGTLRYSDTLWEAVVLCLKASFWQAWRLPLWLLSGKAGFKHRMASVVTLDPTTLPYDQGLLQELGRQRAHGRRIVLATGADQRFAQLIAKHL